MFSGCTSLTEFKVAEGNSALRAVDGNLYSMDGTILYQYAPGKTETSFVVPDGVVELYDRAFSGCACLVNITLPASVQTVSENAFNGWNNEDKTVTVAFKKGEEPAGWPPYFNGTPTFIYAE